MEWVMQVLDLFGDILNVAIGGVPVAVLVLIWVQVAKYSGLAKDGDAVRKWVVALGLAFGAIYVAIQLAPMEIFTVETVAQTVVVGLTGSLLSAMAYETPGFIRTAVAVVKSKQTPA